MPLIILSLSIIFILAVVLIPLAFIEAKEEIYYNEYN